MDRRHVQVDQRQFLVQVRLQKAPVNAHSRVVDNKVDIFSPCLPAGFIEKAHTLLSGRQVRRDHDHIPVRILIKDLTAQLLQTVLPAGRQDQVIAFYRQIFGDLHADAGTGACY